MTRKGHSCATCSQDPLQTDPNELDWTEIHTDIDKIQFSMLLTVIDSELDGRRLMRRQGVVIESKNKLWRCQGLEGYQGDGHCTEHS